MKGFIFEGTSGIGKTTAISTLRQQMAKEQTETTELYITEHYTYQTLAYKKDGSKPTIETISQHFDDLINTLEVYHRHYEKSVLPERTKTASATVILERMALTHCAFMEIDPEPFEPYFRRLKEINLQLIIMHLSPEELRNRLDTAMKVRTGKMWLKHVEDLGGFEATVTYYMAWQERLLAYAKKAEQWIPTHFLDMGQPPDEVNAFLRQFVMSEDKQ